MLFNHVVDVSYCGRDEERKDESGNVAVVGPQVDVDGIQDTEERETPRDTVNDDLLSTREELVDDGAEKENVNYSPD